MIYLAILAAFDSSYHTQQPQNFHTKPSSAQVGNTDDAYTVVANNLEVPWEIAFLPDGDYLVTERPGRLRQIGKNPQMVRIQGAFQAGEGGLLGLALDPQYVQNHYIYLYNTVKKNNQLFNRVERYQYHNGKLSDLKVLLDDIPSAPSHDGGRMAFGPDGYLYITTGDANKPELAQDLKSLAGKILRLKKDGSFPADNPYNSPVYSYGHRDPQGLSWDEQGTLWITDHGPSGQTSSFDRINFIVKGGNYGWPVIKGDETHAGMINPILHSGPNDVWAPASALYWKGSLFFGGLRGQALFEASLSPKPHLKEHYKNRFGRIRTVSLGPDGYFYLLTSNRDGRGYPHPTDDQILKIDPQVFRRD